MSLFLSTRFSALSPYTPGEQPRDQQYIKLNTNESPFPPSPKVLEAVSREAVSQLNLYPDPNCKTLTEKLAALYGVSSEQVFLANGSDDILNFFFMAFCDESRPVAYPTISYGFYPVYRTLYNLPYREIPLQNDFTIDVGDYVGIHHNIVIANPNAPTGLSLSLEEIEEIVTSNPNHVVCIDEAYVDFGGKSCLPLLSKYENLLICQTFSKSRSLAGGRLGFAFGSRALIQDLNTIKFSTNPYAINRLTLLAGEASVDSNDYYMENCKKIMKNRAYTVEELSKLGFFTLKSDANFIFTLHPQLKGNVFYQKLKEHGILVRHFAKEEISDFVRVTIGSRQQMDGFLTVARDILKEVTHA